MKNKMKNKISIKKYIEIIKKMSTEDGFGDIMQDDYDLMVKVDKKEHKILDYFEVGEEIFELNGDADDFGFTVRQMLSINNAIIDHSFDYLHKMMAILYNNTNLNVEQRAELFYTEIPVDYVIPFLKILKNKYTTND